MKSIWNGTITIMDLNTLNEDSMGEFLEIEFTEIGPDYLKATMPVNSKTKQPFGLLHGGASVALAETMGSVATWCSINRDLFIGVGIEINANHLKAVTEGRVEGICTAIKASGKIHVWEIKIYDAAKELCCLCRYTCMVIPKK